MTERQRPPGNPDRQPRNAQFVFLNGLRRERKRVQVYLLGGVRLTGRIVSFDQHAILLETPEGQVFVNHDAVSTVGPSAGRPGRGERPGDRPERSDRPARGARSFDDADEDVRPRLPPRDQPPKPPTVVVVRKRSRERPPGDGTP